MILKTSFRENDDAEKSPVWRLTEYIDKKLGVRDRCGFELDGVGKAQWIEQTIGDEMGRLLTISPSAPVGEDLLDSLTRRAVEEYLGGRYSADYIYSIHDDTDHLHSHVALSGAREDLKMDQEDIDDLKTAISQELDQLLEQEQSLEIGQTQELEFVQLALDGQELGEEAVRDHQSLKFGQLTDEKFQDQRLEQQRLTRGLER